MSAQVMVLCTVLFLLFLMVWAVDGTRTAIFCLMGTLGFCGFLYMILQAFLYLGFKLY